MPVLRKKASAFVELVELLPVALERRTSLSRLACDAKAVYNVEPSVRSRRMSEESGKQDATA